MSAFGDQLNKHLSEIGLTKYRLAKVTGVAESSVIKIANGQRRPTDDVLAKFAQATDFGLNLEQLKAWRALDEMSEDELLAALKARYQDIPSALKALLAKYPDDQDQAILWLIERYGPQSFEDARKLNQQRQ